MKFRIPVFWPASVLSLEVEEALINRIACPSCQKRSLKTVSREELEAGGHIVSLVCESCGRELGAKFVFTGPRMDESPQEYFDLALRNLLESCEGKEFLERLRRLHEEMEEHGWGQYVEKRLKEDLIRYQLQAKIDPMATKKAKKLSKYLKRGTAFLI